MKISFLGAAHEVTGSCTLIETGKRNILVDFGMEQGIDTYVNYDIPVIPGNIDAVFLTHAHIDHSGKIPALVAGGFGKVNGRLCNTEKARRCQHICLINRQIMGSFQLYSVFFKPCVK